MPPKKIEDAEVQRYWEIFDSLAPGAKVMTGDQAAPVLKNSRLPDAQLEAVWDLADIDKDGGLDFEEFIVAMRLIYDLVNGELATTPDQLPDWMVPSSKAHLVQAGRGLTSGHVRAPELDMPDDDDSGLKDGFEWEYTPGERRRYEALYGEIKDSHGYVERHSPQLEELLNDMDIPDTDVNSAWNIINPNQATALGKDAAIYFLHILNYRSQGYRLPRRIPNQLLHSFQNRQIEYNVDHVRNNAARQMADDSTMTGRKAKFGDAYLSRLGVGGGGNSYAPKGTDFGTKTTEDWEETLLKKQLREVEEKILRVEEAAKRREAQGRRSASKPALVKRELEQLLDYKRRELRDLELGEGRAKEGAGLKGVEDDIKTIQEQVAGLEAHHAKRADVLRDLQAQVQAEKAR